MVLGGSGGLRLLPGDADGLLRRRPPSWSSRPPAGLDSSVDGSRRTSEVQIETEAEVATRPRWPPRAAELPRRALSADKLLAGTHGHRHARTARCSLVTFEAGTARGRARRLAGHGPGLPRSPVRRRRRRRSEMRRKTLQAAPRRGDGSTAGQALGQTTSCERRSRPSEPARRPDRRPEQSARRSRREDQRGRPDHQRCSLARSSPVSPVLWLDVLAGLLVGATHRLGDRCSCCPGDGTDGAEAVSRPAPLCRRRASARARSSSYPPVDLPSTRPEPRGAGGRCVRGASSLRDRGRPRP